MICLNCNNEMKNNDIFCRKCGTKYKSYIAYFIERIIYLSVIVLLFVILLLCILSTFN